MADLYHTICSTTCNIVVPSTTFNPLTSIPCKLYKQRKCLYCIKAVGNLPINIRNKVSLLLLLAMLERNRSSALKDAIFFSYLKTVAGTGKFYNCTDLGNSLTEGKSTELNPFLVNAPILHPLKTPEKFLFSDVFKEHKTKTLP